MSRPPTKARTSRKTVEWVLGRAHPSFIYSPSIGSAYGAESGHSLVGQRMAGIGPIGDAGPGSEICWLTTHRGAASVEDLGCHRADSACRKCSAINRIVLIFAPSCGGSRTLRPFGRRTRNRGFILRMYPNYLIRMPRRGLEPRRSAIKVLARWDF